jgi:Protein of unknown function (DUF4239)
MTLWILDNFPTWFLALVVLAGLPLAAVLGCLSVRRRAPSLTNGEHNEVAGVVLSVLGGIYGIVLAFVIVVLWEQFQGAQSIVSEETNSLQQVLRDIQAFPPEDRRPIVQAVGEYAHAVVEDEWDLMSERKSSARTERAVAGMYAALIRYEPTSESTSTFFAEASARIDDVVASRLQRLRQSQYGLPAVLEILLVGGALMIIGCLYLFGTRDRRVHLVMTGAVSTLLAFNLLLALLMEYPYTGDVAVSNEPFRQAELAQFWRPAP